MSASATLGEIAVLTVAPVQSDHLRERARLKKRAQRERRLEAARLRAIAEAERLEREAEAVEDANEVLAPRILREPIEARGRMLRGPLVEIVEGRAVHGAALPQFSSRQNRAARRLQLDWRDVGTGCGAPAVNYGASRGGGDGLGGHQAMLGQIKALARLEAALAFVGAFTPGIKRVVLDRIPIPEWASQTGRSPEDALAWLRAGLDRLSQFYFPPADVAPRKGFLTFGPRRETYELNPLDGGTNVCL